ncbi:MAG: hypothetical protein IKJ46_00175, partial [Tidjanibacter sp.]|nr:hypothetical protein [Tidjanibacter sp.]
MKKVPIITLIITVVALLLLIGSWWIIQRQCSENRRLSESNRTLAEQNQALASRLNHSDHLVASQRLSIGRLRMTIGELEELRREDAERIRALGVGLRNVRTYTLTTTSTLLDTLLAASLQSTVEKGVMAERLADSLNSERLADSLTSERLADNLTDTTIHWRDPWVELSLTPQPDGSTHLHLLCHDTLTQVVHRIPHRWWIFRWGTKALRQEIRSSNPHTKIVFSEYIEI